MQLCTVKRVLSKIQAFGLFDKFDFVEVSKSVHKILPHCCDGVTVDERFDVDDF